MVIVSIVGMAGAGKSEVAKFFEESGFIRIRFGDVTDIEVRKRGLPLNEANERNVRELLRKEYGMAAYAILNLPRISSALKQSDVVIDGLYSWEEHVCLKTYYATGFYVVAVLASPKTRYARLCNRTERSLSEAEAKSRDCSEIENLNKGGPIAMADFTIINETTLENLKKEVKKIVLKLGGKV